ncbi:hypothetical protein ACM66T_07520 [Sulfurimonas sp. ST-25]|uniref:hypothetical protein n=1 Tax=Sulfurimonas sp. ST-25 TaxID=3400151 RepID=UPI003A839547
MEILGIVVHFGLLATIVLVPIFVVSKGYDFLWTNAISLPIICFFLVLMTYWPHFYTDFRLELMGFNFDATSDAERVRNVLPELQEKAKALYWSNMGIGWPLQAIFGMVLFAPYPTAIWGCGALVKYARRKRNNETT